VKRGVAWAAVAVIALGVTTVIGPVSTATGDSVHGHTTTGAKGITRTVAQLQADASGNPSTPHAPLPLRRGPAKTANPYAVPAAPARTTSGPRIAVTNPQTFDGPALESSNPAFPPDTQGDIGPAQFVVTLNSRFRSYDRTGVADGALDLAPETFFASVMTPGAGNFASDPHIRYDRLSHRWFIVMIDVPGGLGTQSNRIMIAVSDGPTITSATAFTFFEFQAPALQFADYPTLGIDAHALYIGTNNFSLAGTYSGSDGYVVQKSSVLGGGPIVQTRLANLSMFTPQGVDDPYDADPSGYFVGVDANTFGQLVLVRVTDPGGASPKKTALSLTVQPTSFPVLVPHSGNTGGNNGRLDGLDDRLLEATMTADGHIWTAHGNAVTSSGASSTTASGNRDGARWYEIAHVATTPTLAQIGTVFDPAASNPSFYWMPTVAVSGQGIMAIGGSTAGTNARANAWYAARLPTATPGTTDTPSTYTDTSSAYNPPGDPGGTGGRRWGDYSLTRVDPLDNQTIWTIQEYASATDTWGVKIARLQAPGPATPSAASGSVPDGVASTHVTLTGTSTASSGWYDPGAGFPQRLKVAIGCGVKVSSVTVLTPTRLDLGLDTRNASPGTCSVTTTNPDGQVSGPATVLQVVRIRPDGLIKRAAAASYKGNNVYNATATNQTVVARRKRHSRQAFSVLVQNDGGVADSFRVRGPGSGPGFVVHYFSGTTDVTSRVVNGTFVTASLAPGASAALRLVVKVRRHARIGTVRSWLVTSTSVHASAKVDAVKAKMRVVRG
jgi:hypothetical protein